MYKYLCPCSKPFDYDSFIHQYLNTIISSNDAASVTFHVSPDASRHTLTINETFLDETTHDDEISIPGIPFKETTEVLVMAPGVASKHHKWFLPQSTYS